MGERIEAWLRLRDAARFQADAKASGAAVRQMGKDAEGAGVSAQRSTKHFGGMEKAMGLLGTTVKWAGIGIAASVGVAAAGVTYAGLKFDSTMEQNTVSFTHFLGSTGKAKAYLDQLYTLAATTPFEFKDVATATKQMLAFGFGAQESIKNLRTIGDAASGLGTGTEGINRMVLALGQMKVAGVVQGDELRQFQEAGINVYKYMEKAGLITKSDIGQIGQMHIDAGKAIHAIMTGMNKDFGGMSKDQAKTWQGQLSTMKDYASQAAGALVQPLFDLGRSSVLPSINKTLQRMSAWARAGGVKSFLSAAGAAESGKKVTGVNKQTAVGTLPITGAKVAVQTPGQLSATQKAGILAGKAIRYVGEAWKWVVDTIKPAMPFLNNILIPFLKGALKGALFTAYVSFKVLGPVLRLVFRLLGWIGTAARPLKGTFEKLGFVMQAWASIAMLGALKAARFLGNAFKSMGQWIGKAASGLYNLGKSIVTKIVEGIKSAPGAILNALKSLLPSSGVFGKALRSASGVLGMASGGVVTQSGWSWVGEQGPELRYMPRGSAVVPQSAIAAPLPSNLSLGGGSSNMVAHVYLDRKKIATAIADTAKDEVARR